MRKIIIQTKQKELYEKLNMLRFTPEVVIRNNNTTNVQRIISNINRGDNYLSSEVVGNYIIIRKKKPVNMEVYLN